MQRYLLLKRCVAVRFVALWNMCCNAKASAARSIAFANMQLQLHRHQAIMQDVYLTESGNGH